VVIIIPDGLRRCPAAMCELENLYPQQMGRHRNNRAFNSSDFRHKDNRFCAPERLGFTSVCFHAPLNNDQFKHDGNIGDKKYLP
jgi:hypothetical protein